MNTALVTTCMYLIKETDHQCSSVDDSPCLALTSAQMEVTGDRVRADGGGKGLGRKESVLPGALSTSLSLSLSVLFTVHSIISSCLSLSLLRTRKRERAGDRNRLTVQTDGTRGSGYWS